MQRRSNSSHAMIVNVFEAWVGLSGLVTGFAYLFVPSSLDKASVAHQIGSIGAWLWTTGYMFGGFLILVGLMFPNPRAEIAGLSLLGGATAINAIAIAVHFGWFSASTVIVYFTLTAASWIRAVIVYRRTVLFASAGRASVNC